MDFLFIVFLLIVFAQGMVRAKRPPTSRRHSRQKYSSHNSRKSPLRQSHTTHILLINNHLNNTPSQRPRSPRNRRPQRLRPAEDLCLSLCSKCGHGGHPDCLRSLRRCCLSIHSMDRNQNSCYNNKNNNKSKKMNSSYDTADDRQLHQSYNSDGDADSQTYSEDSRYSGNDDSENYDNSDNNHKDGESDNENMDDIDDDYSEDGSEDTGSDSDRDYQDEDGNDDLNDDEDEEKLWPTPPVTSPLPISSATSTALLLQARTRRQQRAMSRQRSTSNIRSGSCGGSGSRSGSKSLPVGSDASAMPPRPRRVSESLLYRCLLLKFIIFIILLPLLLVWSGWLRMCMLLSHIRWIISNDRTNYFILNMY